MKSTILMLMLLTSIIFSNEMVLVESLCEGPQTFDVSSDIEVVSTSMSLGCPAMITVTTGGILAYYTQLNRTNGQFVIPTGVSWLTLNGGEVVGSRGTPHLDASYPMYLEAGSYDFELHINAAREQIHAGFGSATVHNARISILIIYEDTAQNAVCENPPENADDFPHSMISAGPSITIPGCQEIVDLSGRRIDYEASGNEIMISSLPQGTYFAETSDQRTIKIIKM